MEPLMRLVVPDLDGGLLKPLFNTVSENIGNLTVRTGFEFDLGLLLNQTEPHELNLTCGLNTSHVDMGRPLLVWYFERLRSQIPLFITASVLWLGLLLVLIVGHLYMRHRVRSRVRMSIQRSRRRTRLRPLFILLTAALPLIVIGCVLAVLHWSGRAQFSGMSDPTRESDNDTTAGSKDWPANLSVSRTQLTATFRRTIDEFDRFVELAIVDTNVTVLAVCKEELVNVLRTLEVIAKYLLDKLAVDFKLAPLLQCFDDFIELVKLLVDSMREVKASRFEVAVPLSEFTTLIDSTRQNLRRLVSEACAEAGKSGTAPPLDLCQRIKEELAQLAVGVNHRQLDTDSSVTIVTLLEKMLKLNFSEVEGQVNSAKGQLYGSLDLVKAQVRKGFDQLVVAVSGQFENTLVDAELFRSNLRGAKRDQGFLGAMESIDKAVLGLSVILAIGSIAFLGILLLALFVSLRYVMSFRGGLKVQNPAGGGDDGTDEVDLVFIGTSNLSGESANRSKKQNSTNGNAQFSLPLNTPELPRRASRKSVVRKGPSNWHENCVLLSCLLVLAALVYACVVFYAGAEAHMDACRYLTTDSGLAKVDQMVSSLVRDKLWPQIETLIDREVKIPLGITVDQIPKELFGPVMQQCRNDSTTIFQALGLSNLINVSSILRSQAVLKALSKGGVMIEDLVRGLNTSNLIPPEVDDLLQKTLPSFANVIDAENFAPSIFELGKPLLIIGGRWPNLRGDLTQLEVSLLHANSTDRRAFVIRHLADDASSLIERLNGTLSCKLNKLLRHYTTLQTNRRLTNLTLALTASAVALKGALSDKENLLSSIRVRYNETLEVHMEAIGNLVNDILSRLQSRVGRCRPLRDVFQIPAEWCRGQIQPLPSTGFYLMTSCLVFYTLILVLMTTIHLIRHQHSVSDEL